MHFRSTLAQLTFINYYVERHKKYSALIPHIYLYCEKAVNLHREKTRKKNYFKNLKLAGWKENDKNKFYPIEFFETCCQK